MRKAALALAAVLLAHPAGAEEVRFTLTVDYPLLRAAMARQLGFDANGEAVVSGRADSCRSLVVRELGVEAADANVRLLARADARMGFGILGFCLAPLTWEGWVETVGVPVVGTDWELRLR